MTKEINPTEFPVPRYDLIPSEITNLESQLAEAINDMLPDIDGVFAAWVDRNSAFANVVRTYEKNFWHDIDDIMAPHEDRSKFLLLLDMRNVGDPHVVHVFRVSDGLAESEMEVADSTGIILIDDLINSGQNFTRNDFVDFYQQKGVKISDCVSVETNQKIKRAEHYNGLPMSQIGYIAIFEKLQPALREGNVFVFASVNKDAIESFKLVGLEYESIAGREDLKIPVSEGEFDNDYTAVAIPSSSENLKIFTSLVPLGAVAIDVKKT